MLRDYHLFWLIFLQNVLPDPTKSCGPYKPIKLDYSKNSKDPSNSKRDEDRSTDIYKNHDTIGMIVIDKAGNISAGTSTNGMNHKVPG